MVAGTNFSGRWRALGACLTGNRELLAPGPEQRLASSWVGLGAFRAEISSIRFLIVVCSALMPSNCRDRFHIASRSCCNSSCFCGLLLAEGGETDVPWHGGNSLPTDNLLSRILFLTDGPAQCLLGAAKAWFRFGVSQPGQRDLRLAGITNRKMQLTEWVSRTVRRTRLQNEMRFLTMYV